jgi:hypothetical protein
MCACGMARRGMAWRVWHGACGLIEVGFFYGSRAWARGGRRGRGGGGGGGAGGEHEGQARGVYILRS